MNTEKRLREALKPLADFMITAEPGEFMRDSCGAEIHWHDTARAREALSTPTSKESGSNEKIAYDISCQFMGARMSKKHCTKVIKEALDAKDDLMTMAVARRDEEIRVLRKENGELRSKLEHLGKMKGLPEFEIKEPISFEMIICKQHAPVQFFACGQCLESKHNELSALTTKANKMRGGLEKMPHICVSHGHLPCAGCEAQKLLKDYQEG